VNARQVVSNDFKNVEVNSRLSVFVFGETLRVKSGKKEKSIKGKMNENEKEKRETNMHFHFHCMIRTQGGFTKFFGCFFCCFYSTLCLSMTYFVNNSTTRKKNTQTTNKFIFIFHLFLRLFRTLIAR
jgi:hypothetical protein